MPKIKRVLIRGGGIENEIYPWGRWYRYIKRDITAVKSNVWTTQASEFEICDENWTKMPWPTWTTITANHPWNNNEWIEKLIDWSTSTKYCTGYNPEIIIVIDVWEWNKIDISQYPKYKWYTANDVANRDPNSWTIQWSNDWTDYTLLSTVTNANVTWNRNSLAGTWNIKD